MKTSTRERKANRRRGFVLVRNVMLGMILLVMNLFTENAFAASERYEIAFVDLALQDAQALAEEVGAKAEVFYINSQSDGIRQMVEILKDKEHIDAIHIFSHGDEGKILLGNAELSLETLQKYSKELQAISNTLKKGGDLLIYGCNVAKGEEGLSFINQLSSITNADIAASSNDTGAKLLGGDWNLEIKVGKVETRTIDSLVYNGLLQTWGTMSFAEEDLDLKSNNTSITRLVGGRPFILTGGYGDSNNGLDFDGDGIYAYEGPHDEVKLTISVESGYMFSISSFMAKTQLSNVRVDLTYANGETGNFLITGVNTGTLTQVSSFSKPIENVKQVILSSDNEAVFNDFNIHNIKLIPDLPAATTATATSLTSTGATLNGEVNAQGDATTVIFQYGTSVAYGGIITAVQSPLNALSTMPVSSSITGLMPGTTYHYRVLATNAAGTNYGENVSFTTPAEVPGAPTIGEVTAGNGQATISFTAPVSDGGAAIIEYIVTSHSGEITAIGVASPIIVTGLTNGIDYSFTIAAKNSAGTGPVSPASNIVTPKASQTITFNNPGAQNFGSTPTLTATSSAGSEYPVTFTSDTPSVCTITSDGLLTFISSGTARVRASQPGDSAYLPATDVTQSFTVNAVWPGAPTVGTVTAGNGQVTINFTPPLFTGGAAITGYTVTSSPGGFAGTGASGPITVTGLTNGTAYTFTVTATNSAGTGPASVASNSVTPKASQTITFANPGAQNFGSTPTLTATSSAGSEYPVTFTSDTPSVCTITSGGVLTFISSGTATIRASQPGDSSYLAAPDVTQSFTVNPVVPGAPTIGTATAGETQAIISFTAPAFTGGAAITGYTVTSNPGGFTGTGASGPITVTGLTNGMAYTFTVTATNSEGAGPASLASNSVTPRAEQTITFNNPGAQNFGTTPTFTATSSSGRTPIFTSDTPSVCTITSGGLLTFISSGTATIRASQPGDSSYLAAPDVTQSFTVNPVAPGAPTIGEVTEGYGQATISFTAPAFTGGAAITGYTVTSSPGGLTGTGASGPITVTGLTNGMAYTFTVTATNSAGPGPASAASISVTPKASQTITFNNPGAQNFGTTPTLTATSSAGSGFPVTFTSDTPSVCTITSGGLLTFISAGTARITASQPGDSAYLPATDVTQQFTVNPVVPGAPTIGTAIEGNGQATISFTSPAFTGGAAITGYTVTSNPGGFTVTGAGSPITVTGLTNAEAYTFTVTATNSAGIGIASQPSNSITPIHILTDEERVETDYAYLAIGYAGTDTASSITQNITLLEVGSSGTTIIWSSDKPLSISNRGEVTRPVGTDAQVILTATITRNSVTRTKTFAVTVLKQPSSTSGGSGGGGSSAPTPTTPAENAADIEVNGKKEAAGTINTTTQNGQSVTTIVVDSDKLAAKLQSAGPRAVVTIQLRTDAERVVGEFNGQMIKNMETKQAIVEIKTAAATYTVPTQQIDIEAISKQIGKDVDLKDIKVKIEIAKPTSEAIKFVEAAESKGTFTLVVPPVEFIVKCTYGGQTVEVKTFNSYVERMIVIPAGIDPNKITTGIVVDEEGGVRHVPTKVVKIDGTYYAVINSLTNSIYAAIWNPMTFNDVENHWAKETINDMGSRMVISGVGNNKFDPDRDITRAEFAAIMVRALGLKPGTGTNVFNDVKSTDWYCSSIETATAYNMIAGYGAGKFGPMDKITREQAMSIIARAMNTTGLKVDIQQEDIQKLLAEFGDASNASEYAKTNIAVCIKAGIASSNEGNMKEVKGNITRAEVAVIVRRLLQKSNLI